jgi:hypothetical protein
LLDSGVITERLSSPLEIEGITAIPAAITATDMIPFKLCSLILLRKF